MNDAEQESVANVSWSPVPEAARLVERQLGELLHTLPELGEFAARVRARTGMRLADWTSELSVGQSGSESELRAAGFEPVHGQTDVFRHPGALLPTVKLTDGPGCVVLEVDDVMDFLLAGAVPHASASSVDAGGVRKACVMKGAHAEVWVRLTSWRDVSFGNPRHHFEEFRSRARTATDPRHDFEAAQKLIRAAQSDLGLERAAHVFFAAEREHWTERNRAAALQKARQDELGLGWGTLDHFTYRSSRIHFAELIETLSLLGLRRRERFHAGAEAGWGAQVMGLDEVGITVFADVDLEPEEASLDFSRGPLAPTSHLGTVGLWCCLHGEAFSGAGLHHVARQGSFTDLRALIFAEGIDSMEPFANLPHLKQCFTRGETWKVSEERLTAALRMGAVDASRAEAIRAGGAIGSHLELIERSGGYKGFLQRGVSDIIRRTDPRHADATRPAA